jgi:DNA-binding NarL/FixJ family response regulator
VLLAEDHEVFRLGATNLLETMANCKVCAEAANGRDALKLAASTRPDVAVIDLDLPALNGLELTRQIRRSWPETEVVILTGDVSLDMKRRSYEAGAKAFILKVDAATHLADAVKMVHEHRFYITPEAHAALHLAKQPETLKRKRSAAPELTSREREVIQLLAEGESNKEAASSLGISIKTVQTHRATIMKKLKLGRFSQLILYAIRHKIIHA